MIYNLNELNIKDTILINEDVVMDDTIIPNIYGLENAKVMGKIYKDNMGDIILNCHFFGTMFIEDSITLDKVPYDFSINIEEKVNEIKENYQECYKIHQNTLDLKMILWQNIVLEVPISYTLVSDASIQGDGWKLISEENESGIDPRLKKLEDLLKGDD